MSGPVVEVGAALPPLTLHVTRETLVRYAGASGDFNPIHFSDHAATDLGLPGVIAHGMLTMGLAVRAVTDWAGPGARLVSYGVRFTRPVPVPDDGVGAELLVAATVTAVDAETVTVTLDATCDGEKVLGAARVVLAGGPA
ncbi:MaoC/PaaZ C-terminal domain-containing protein [Microlunatus antarcticus]|uniref:Acyl dehydratase n=1 Tax=Microlunatus antarcticus TaxID=53388 RepID=A0A7W5JYM0_9ACTN|nr:acyl dehydratase [Microlunatus antarcticus]